jgi:hypothetical protein
MTRKSNMLTPENPFRGYTTRDLQRCAKRELGWRRKVYPNRVLTGRMTPAEAEAEITKMEVIAEHFAALEERERLL